MSGHSGGSPGPATGRLAEYAAGLSYADLPAAVVERARLCVLDAVGCGVFGADLPWSRKLQEVVRQLQTPPQATIWGTDASASATDAALCNGTAAHGFELDDIFDAAFHHPGSAVVPAILALADLLGGVSGQRLIESVVAAYEVSGRIGLALGQAVFFRGFHPQGAHGSLSAAVASGKMLGLSAEQMVHSLGIAGSQASGLMAAQEGAMVKRMHAGQAARNGVLSALLAAQGFTGIEDVLEAKFGGYAVAFAGLEDLDVKAVCAGLGERYVIQQVGFKLYPAVAGAHCTIRAMEALMAEHGFGAEDVEDVEVRTSSLTVRHSGWSFQARQAPMEAQMNIPFVVAAVLRYGTVSPACYAPEVLADPWMLAMTRRVKVLPDAEIDAGGRDLRHAGRVAVRLKNGSEFSRFERFRPGSKESPVDRAALVAKFRGLADGVLGESRARQLEQLLLNLEQVQDGREVTELLKA